MARALAAAAAILAAVVCGGATPETTCRAAARSDRRVDYHFCVSRLSQHHDSPDADTWGLAKVAADVGVLMAGNGAYDIKAMLAGKKEQPAAARGSLEQCEALYDRMGSAFAEAYDGIDRRDYATGKEKAGEAERRLGADGHRLHRRYQPHQVMSAPHCLPVERNGSCSALLVARP